MRLHEWAGKIRALDGTSYPGNTTVEIINKPAFEKAKGTELDYIMEVEKASFLMLCQTDILKENSRAQLAKALMRFPYNEVRAMPYDKDYAEDMFFAVEKKLSENAGECATNLHLGRSRNDMMRTVNKMLIRQKLIELHEKLNDLVEVLIALAYEHVDTLMPGYVASTLQYETRLVIEYLASCLRKNIAMVAFREHGMNDAARCFEVLSIAKDYNLPITQRDFYYRGNSLEACMRKFHDNIHKYNAAICPNSASAICLINFCKQNMVEIPEDLFVISFSDMNVANYSSPSLTSVKTDYAMIGSKIVYVWNYLEAHADENTIMNIRVRSQLSIRESTANMPFIAQSPGGNVDHIPPYVDRYYEYRVTNSLFKLEKEMQGFDELDFQIVQMIMDGYSYEEITDRTYMSISGIRYRVKRIFERLNVKNKKMFVKKLQESLGKNKM